MIHRGKLMEENAGWQQNSCVLVVEDNETQQRTLVDLMKMEGFEVIGCSTAAEATEQLSRMSTGVVVLDPKLPDHSGTELLQKLSVDSNMIRVIIRTAYSSYESAKDALNLGAFAYVEKADDPEILLLHVHRAFGESLRLYTNDLEKAVSKRTEELQEANGMLQQEIAERKQAEKQLKQAKKQAEAANVAKSQFLANMSHELRTPMSVIIGFADLLALEELTDDQKLQTGLIQKAGKSLLRIIDDVLDISRIEAGKLEIEITECSLSKLLGGIETMMRPLAGEQGLQFEVSCAEQLPTVIRNDRDRIHQCLVNLIGNAIKFTTEGHVHLKVSLEDRQGKPFVRFDVEDTGIGISADKHETVFETFTQADGSYTRRHGGTGLGLAITKQLAELLGGDISFTSRVDKGSVFSLVVPAGIDIEPQKLLDEEHADNESIRKPGTRQAPPFSGKVLVVEDHKNIRLLIGKILKRLGFEVTLAEDGQQAVEKVLEESFDLVLMDIRMPVLNGFEATERLREKGVTTPIIALTAHAMKGDREKCLEAGCDDYISKPFDQEELRRTLSKYVPAGTYH